MERDGTILLVENSEDDRVLIRYAFGEAAILNPVIELRDGQEAIEYLSGKRQYADRERFPLPCLIITSLKMPRVNGLELLQWVKKQHELDDVPRLVLSGLTYEKDLERVRELGGYSYAKPSQFTHLVGVALQIYEDWISEHCQG